jgi:hypothetical protein
MLLHPCGYKILQLGDHHPTLMHEPYENRWHQKADFRVKYRFLSKEEGGRVTGPPFQGYRGDFSFAGEDGVYMIHPEFEYSDGNVILYNDRSVPHEGTARMWILINEMRPYHYERVKVGAKGSFREGAKLIADCEIIEILDLRINPTK